MTIINAKDVQLMLRLSARMADADRVQRTETARCMDLLSADVVTGVKTVSVSQGEFRMPFVPLPKNAMPVISAQPVRLLASRISQLQTEMLVIFGSNALPPSALSARGLEFVSQPRPLI